MIKCVVCKEDLSSYENVKCSGESCGALHFECAGITEQVYRKLSKDKKDKWKCGQCGLNIRNTRGRKQTTTEDAPTENEKHQENLSADNKSLNDLYKEIMNLNEKLASLPEIMDKIDKLEKSVTFCSSKVDEFSAIVVDLNKKIASLTKSNNELLVENKHIKGELSIISAKVNNMEQKELKNKVKIVGIPVTNNEDCKQIVQLIGQKIGVDKGSETIVSAYRQGNQKNNIIVKYENTDTKVQWLKLFKNKRSLYSKEINSNLSEARIYINDHLTYTNKKIFYNAKLKAKQINYKFVWVKDGNIYVRQSENSKILKINNMNDIEMKITI